MEKKKTCLMVSCLVLACLLSTISIQGNTGRNVRSMIGSSSKSNGIIVTSPTKSDSWEVGSTHEITWSSGYSTGTVGIWIANENLDFAWAWGKILADALAIATGSFTWIIPNNINITTSNAYIIYVFMDNSPSINGTSDNFTITTSSSNTTVYGFPIDITLVGLAIGVLGIVAITSRKRQLPV